MRVIAANAERYNVSAPCRIFGVARSTYYRLLPQVKAADLLAENKKRNNENTKNSDYLSEGSNNSSASSDSTNNADNLSSSYFSDRPKQCSSKKKQKRPKSDDPLEQVVIDIFYQNRCDYGVQKMKIALDKKEIKISCKKISKIMKKFGLISTCASKKYRQILCSNSALPAEKSLAKHQIELAEEKAIEQQRKVLIAQRDYAKNGVICKAHDKRGLAINEFADEHPVEQKKLNKLDRRFNGWKPHTHICADLTYMRIYGKWYYICLLVDLYNREIVGHACSPCKNAQLVLAAFATLEFSLEEIELFHSDNGSEFNNAYISRVLKAFQIERSVSKKGCPFDNAVVESTNRLLKADLLHGKIYTCLQDLHLELNSWIRFYNNRRIHGALGNMSPVEFRQAGLMLQEA